MKEQEAEAEVLESEVLAVLEDTSSRFTRAHVGSKLHVHVTSAKQGD